MEIKQAKVVVKLDKEERDNIANTINLLYEIRKQVSCDNCPFKERCDQVSESECLLHTLARDLNYINKNCE